MSKLPAVLFDLLHASDRDEGRAYRRTNQLGPRCRRTGEVRSDLSGASARRLNDRQAVCYDYGQLPANGGCRRGVALSLLSDVLPFAADFLRGTIVPLPGHFTGTSRKILSLLIR